MSKEMFQDVWEGIYNAAIDEGLGEAAAERRADAMTYDAYRDRLADMADNAKIFKRENW